MASITSATTGLWTATGTWTGGSVPVLGDKVTVASAHVVTVEGACAGGDDSATGINVNTGGALKFSRTANSSLAIRGQLVVNGIWNRGRESDPIPAGITSTVIYNDSAVMAAGKWGVTIGTACQGWHEWGADRQVYTAITALSSSTVFNVADATGWIAGNVLFFGPTTPGIATTETRAISSVVPTTGTAATITLTAALTNANYVGRPIANVSSNVRSTLSNAASFAGQILLSFGSGVGAGVLEMGNVEHTGRGHAAATPAGLSIAVAVAATQSAVYRVCAHDVVSVAGSTVTTAAAPVAAASSFALGYNARPPAAALEPVACSRTGHSGFSIAGTAPAAMSLESPVLIGCLNALANATTTGAAQLLTANGPRFAGCNSLIAGSFYGAVAITGGVIDGYGAITSTSAVNAASITFSAVDMDGLIGVTNAGALTTNAVAAGITLDGCDLPAGAALARAAGYATAPMIYSTFFRDKDGDPTAQQYISPFGLTERDNSTTLHGASSVRLDPWFAGIPNTHTVSVPVGAGQTVVIMGATAWNTTYGSGTPPTVALSGLGITPQVHVNSASAGVFQNYTLTATNSGAAPGNFLLTYTAQTTANSASASAWFDGVPEAPWITTVRHFGYLWDLAAARTADPSITLTEAAALALPVTVDHTLHTIDISVGSSATAREVYEASMADLCQAAQLVPTLVPVHISTPDAGVSFVSSYAVSGMVVGAYTDSSGAHVTISSPTLRAGTLVQVYDLAGASEIYIGTPGTSLAVPAIWSADKTLRVRAMQCGTTTASLFVEAIGTLTSTGASFLITQRDDPVYAANAIDGSAVTGITIDDTLMRFALAGRTTITWGEIYAYETYWLSTTAGIRDDGRIIDAVDTANYKFRGFTLKNLGPGALTITGGWGRDATTGRTADIIDTSGFPIFTSPDAVVPFGTGGASPAEIADKVLGRNLAGGADGGRTVRDALRANRNRTEIAGSTLTVYSEDDTTPAWTAAITTAPRDALQSVDPA